MVGMGFRLHLEESRSRWQSPAAVPNSALEFAPQRSLGLPGGVRHGSEPSEGSRMVTIGVCLAAVAGSSRGCCRPKPTANFRFTTSASARAMRL